MMTCWFLHPNENRRTDTDAVRHYNMRKFRHDRITWTVRFGCNWDNPIQAIHQTQERVAFHNRFTESWPVSIVRRCGDQLHIAQRCGGSAGDSHQQVYQASGLTERRSARPRFGNKPCKRSIEKHSKDEVEKGCGPRSHITQSGPHVAKVSSKFMHAGRDFFSSILSQGSKGTST